MLISRQAQSFLYVDDISPGRCLFISEMENIKPCTTILLHRPILRKCELVLCLVRVEIPNYRGKCPRFPHTFTYKQANKLTHAHMHAMHWLINCNT